MIMNSYIARLRKLLTEEPERVNIRTLHREHFAALSLVDLQILTVEFAGAGLVERNLGSVQATRELFRQEIHRLQLKALATRAVAKRQKILATVQMLEAKCE